MYVWLAGNQLMLVASSFFLVCCWCLVYGTVIGTPSELAYTSPTNSLCQRELKSILFRSLQYGGISTVKGRSRAIVMKGIRVEKGGAFLLLLFLFFFTIIPFITLGIYFQQAGDILQIWGLGL